MSEKKSLSEENWGHLTPKFWAYQNKVQLNFIRPEKPIENAFVESFNG